MQFIGQSTGSRKVGIYGRPRRTARNGGTWSSKWVLGESIQVRRHGSTRTHKYALEETWSGSVAAKTDNVESQLAWLSDCGRLTCRRCWMAQSVGPANTIHLNWLLDSKKAAKVAVNDVIGVIERALTPVGGTQTWAETRKTVEMNANQVANVGVMSGKNWRRRHNIIWWFPSPLNPLDV